MAKHDLKADKVQVNSLESKDTIRIGAKNIIGYTTGHTLEDFDLIYKYAVEQMIAAAPGLGNRFPTIIWTDDSDNEIGRTTTDKNKCIQFFSVTGELLQQWCPTGTNVVPPPVPPADLDIAWTLIENEPEFLDLNLHFRAPDGSVLSDHYSEGSGLVGDGGIKPKSGQLMRVELTYEGGIVDDSEVEVTPWDGPTRVTLEIRKNGVWFDGFVKEYPTVPVLTPPEDPQALSLGYKFITPTEFDTWFISAKAEPYTLPEDETSDVDQPPIAVVEISFIGGSDTIADGEASFILSGVNSSDPDGDVVSHKWTSLTPGITFSAP